MDFPLLEMVVYELMSSWGPIDSKRLAKIKPQIVGRLNEFASVKPSQWPRELVFCLFTPQTNPYHAEAALVELERVGLFRARLSVGQIEKVLRTPSSYVRFHKTKAERVVKFLDNWTKLEEILGKGLDPISEREALIELIDGYGLKESSHALRNIGRRNLAILDRHILRNLNRFGVIDRVPKSLNVKVYKEIEARFRSFADEIEESMDVLDLFFWSSETGTIFK